MTPQTLWVVVVRHGWNVRGDEQSALAVAKRWDEFVPADAPHRVVAYVPQGASVPRELPPKMREAMRFFLPPNISADKLWECIALNWNLVDAAPREPVKCKACGFAPCRSVYEVECDVPREPVKATEPVDRRDPYLSGRRYGTPDAAQEDKP